MSINEVKWTVFFCYFVPLLWRPFCFWLCPTATLELCQAFSILYPPLPSHLEFSSLEAWAWICEPSCNAILNFVLPLQCGLHDSFFVTDSILGLADSCASAIQLNLVFVWDASAFPFLNAKVSRLLAWAIVLLHGIAAAIGVSNFRLTFLMMSLYSSSLGSIQ